MKLKYRILRWLGVVSPSGAYPTPPRWAMSKQGRARWYPEHERDYARDALAGQAVKVQAIGQGSVAAGGSIGTVVTGQPWAADVAAGPIPRGALTRFSTGDPQHEHGWTSRGLCGPDSGFQVDCFDRAPYVPEADREQPYQSKRND